MAYLPQSSVNPHFRQRTFQAGVRACGSIRPSRLAVRGEPDNNEHQQDHYSKNESPDPSTLNETARSFLVHVEFAVPSRDEYAFGNHAAEDPSLAATDFLRRPCGRRVDRTGSTEIPH